MTLSLFSFFALSFKIHHCIQVSDCSLTVFEGYYTALDLSTTDSTGIVSENLDEASEAVEDEGTGNKS